MKKFIFMLIFALTCEKVSGSWNAPEFFRCENDEIICYTKGTTEKSNMFCKFKED